MTALAPAAGWRLWVRRHERAIAAWYLAAVALLVLALVFGPTRWFLLGRVQGVAERWDARWDGRLAWGDSLVAAGRWDAAERYLEQLDRRWPARVARHVRDKQRERLLQQLARTYEALGKNGRAMATYDRLVAFDSLNYYNHFVRARGAERMLSGWAIAPEARDGFAGVLVLYPNHLPSVRGYLQYFAERGDWRPVVEAYRAYLDAFLAQGVTFRFGDTTVTVQAIVDGRPHVVMVPVPRPAADTVAISTGGFAFALDSARATAHSAVGEAATGALEMAIPQTALVARGLERTDRGAWRPTGDSAALRLALPRVRSGVAQLRLVLTLYKPADLAMWKLIIQSRNNLLDYAALAEDGARTVPFPRALTADSVLGRQGWASSGLQFAVPVP